MVIRKLFETMKNVAGKVGCILFSIIGTLSCALFFLTQRDVGTMIGVVLLFMTGLSVLGILFNLFSED